MNSNTPHIAVALRAAEQFHYVRSIITALAARGHRITVLYDPAWSKDAEGVTRLEAFLASFPRAASRPARSPKGTLHRLVGMSRELLSYRRYLVVPGQSGYYKERWRRVVLPIKRGRASRLLDRALASGPMTALLKTSGCSRLLAWVESRVRPDRRIMDDLLRLKPDALVATPVNMRYSSADLEYLKAAKRLGIPTALPVYSWDNLTTKGIIHVVPDRLLVWNDVQRLEAERHHGISGERVRVIGAPFFDVWFGHSANVPSYEEFCADAGLNAKHPMIVYLGSSRHIAKNEVWLIRSLHGVLRQSADRGVRNMQIVVRPHPANSDIYEHLMLDGVVVYPSAGSLPDTEEAYQLFATTLRHAVAALGVNTSAMIDAIIFDKPVISVLTDEYHRTQRDAEHFAQLKDANALEMLHRPDELPQTLLRIMNGRDERNSERRAFVERFIRPQGMSRGAGEAAADEIEALMRRQ